MTVQIILGDARAALQQLPDESVHCIVTSPPYFGLRDYGTGRWDGGDPACAHVRKKRGEASGLQRNHFHCQEIYREECRLCGASRVDQQIGLEWTPQEFIAALVDVFREARRVLRNDGTLWVNMGDSYASTGGTRRQGGSTARAGRANVKEQMTRGTTAPPEGFKPKDLLMIPARLAIALQDDGWWLRQDIVWRKENPMPESVRDRCTKAHEYLFLLAKSETYHFDADAIAEEITLATVQRLSQNVEAQAGSERPYGGGGAPMKAVVRRSGNKARKPGSARGCPEGTGQNVAGSIPWEGSTRNKRSVWSVATVPLALEHCKGCSTTYTAAEHRELPLIPVGNGKHAAVCGVCSASDQWLSHFATFPPKLIEPCILAGCPVGGTVLDPFGGAGTTGLVADRLRRNAILIELNPHYAAMARYRLDVDRAPFPMLEAMGA